MKPPIQPDGFSKAYYDQQAEAALQAGKPTVLGDIPNWRGGMTLTRAITSAERVAVTASGRTVAVIPVDDGPVVVVKTVRPVSLKDGLLVMPFDWGSWKVPVIGNPRFLVAQNRYCLEIDQDKGAMPCRNPAQMEDETLKPGAVAPTAKPSADAEPAASPKETAAL